MWQAVLKAKTNKPGFPGNSDSEWMVWIRNDSAVETLIMYAKNQEELSMLNPAIKWLRELNYESITHSHSFQDLEEEGENEEDLIKRLKKIKAEILPILVKQYGDLQRQRGGKTSFKPKNVAAVKPHNYLQLRPNIDHFNTKYLPDLLQEAEDGDINTEIHLLADFLEENPRFVKNSRQKVDRGILSRLLKHIEKHPRFIEVTIIVNQEEGQPVDGVILPKGTKENEVKKLFEGYDIKFEANRVIVSKKVKFEDIKKPKPQVTVEAAGTETRDKRVEYAGKESDEKEEAKHKKWFLEQGGEEKNYKPLSELRSQQIHTGTGQIQTKVSTTKYPEAVDLKRKFSELGINEILIKEEVSALSKFFGYVDSKTKAAWGARAGYIVEKPITEQDVKDYMYKLLQQDFPQKQLLLPVAIKHAYSGIFTKSKKGNVIQVQQYVGSILDLNLDNVKDDEIYEQLLTELNKELFLDRRKAKKAWMDRAVGAYTQANDNENTGSQRSRARDNDAYPNISAWNEDTNKPVKGIRSKIETLLNEGGKFEDNFNEYYADLEKKTEERLKGYSEAKVEYFKKLLEEDGLDFVITDDKKTPVTREDIEYMKTHPPKFKGATVRETEIEGEEDTQKLKIYTPQGVILTKVMLGFQESLKNRRKYNQYKEWKKSTDYEADVREEAVSLLYGGDIELPPLSAKAVVQINSLPSLEKGLMTLVYFLALDDEEKLFSDILSEQIVSGSVIKGLNFWELLRVIQAADAIVGEGYEEVEVTQTVGKDNIVSGKKIQGIINNRVERLDVKLKGITEEKKQELLKTDDINEFKSEVEALASEFEKAITRIQTGFKTSVEDKLDDFVERQEFYREKVGNVLYQKLEDFGFIRRE